MSRHRTPRRKSEPTIALINVVFLMLIFFMVAGTLAQPLEPDLKLVNVADLETTAPPDALVITASGDLMFRGTPVEDATPYLNTLEPGATARIVPDRESPAARLVTVAQALQAAGAEKVVIVTEKALQ